MSALETGMIDGVYGPPMAVTAMQWFRRVKHIYDMPIADSSGAVLVAKKTFDTLSGPDRKILLEVSAKHLRRLNLLTRKENEAALIALQRQGLTLSPRPGAEVLRHYEDLGRIARRELAGKLFSPELLDRVERALNQRRGAAKDASSNSISEGPLGGKTKKS
jgi:TRAP-type C4-dicarboxylate transport system substrate-binding protein